VTHKVLSIKDIRTQGEGFVQCGQEGSGYSILAEGERGGVLSLGGTFGGRGGGVNFFSDVYYNT